ncbi:hypothetical protein PG987_011319 [Apiospora arundinis]
MCTGTVYHLTRCGHCIAHYSSHCRLYQATHPPQEPKYDTLIPEPHEKPCPEIRGANDKPAPIVRLDDSCARCMPRVHQWKVEAHKRYLAERVTSQAHEHQLNGDRLAAAVMRNKRLELDRGAQEQIAAIDWSIIPAVEPVFPRPGWTVEDDRGLYAMWIGYQLVWGGDEESLLELRYMYKEHEEKKRQKEEEAREEVEEEEEDDDDSDYSYYSNSLETRTGYHVSENEYEDQDDQMGRNSRNTQSSHEYPRQLRKQKGREVLGESEFFSFSNLEDSQDGRDEAYHIANNEDDDDDIWFRAGQAQPQDGRTTITDSVPERSHINSQWTPNIARPANQSRRTSVQAVRGSKKKYDLRPFIPSQHQTR